MSRLIFILGNPGVGKGQPKTDIVPTPIGDKVFGDLMVGDKVFGSQGKPVNVIGVYDRGVIPSYEVLFSDGAKKIVDGTHIWTLWRKREGKIQYRNITTSELEGQALNGYYLPTTAVEYETKELLIDPYLLGLWLADGSLHNNNVRITKKDENVVRYLKKVASNYKEYNSIYQFNFTSDNPNLNRQLLNDYGFDNLTKSRRKAIPHEYLLGDTKQRRELLRGLMDGDGSYPHQERTSPQRQVYSTTSQSLARTVHRLLTSLGIVARDIHIVDKREGKTDYFQVSFNENGIYNKRSIRSVVKIEDEDIQCIEVDDPNSLYVCDTYNHLLTHNTASLRNLKKDEVGYVTASGKELPYKADFKPVTAKSLADIKKAVLSSKKPILVIDDINFALQYEISSQKDNPDQWTVYRKLKDDFYDLITTIANKPGDQNIYLMGHIEPDQERVTLRTAGKAISTGATPPEGFTNIVLEAIVDPMDGFVLRTRTTGDGVKSPGLDNDRMFNTDTVPNDLVLVNKAINKYYGGSK